MAFKKTFVGGASCDASENRSNRRGKVTVAKYCRAHAPLTLDSFGLIASESHLQLVGGVMIPLVLVVGSLQGIRILKVPDADLLDPVKGWKGYVLFQLIMLGRYLFMSFIFFWWDQAFPVRPHDAIAAVGEPCNMDGI